MSTKVQCGYRDGTGSVLGRRCTAVVCLVKKKRNLGESSRVLSPSCWADFKPSGMPFSVSMVLCIRVSIGNQEKGRDLMCLRQNNDFLQPSFQIQCSGGHNARERVARNRMTVSLYEPSNVRIEKGIQGFMQ